MTAHGNRMVLADIDGPSRAAVACAAQDAGFAVQTADSAADVLGLLDSAAVDLLVIDVAVPAIDGIALLGEIAMRRDRVRVLVTGDADARLLAAAERFARQSGIDVVGVLRKPVASQDLAALLGLVGPSTRQLRRTALEHAISHGEIEAHYQPKYRRTPQGLRLMGAEALARWRHPRLGLLAPAMFFDDLEAGGLESALTERMLHEVTSHAAHCRDRGHDLQFAVNFTPGLISDPSWPGRIERYLDAHDLPAGCLALELTEGSMVDHTLRSIEVLTRLRVRGLALLLDDFGTGYSSLMRLHQLPFNEIKIDRAFISEMFDQESARTIVAVTIDLAHRLGLTACAEGVETQEAVDALCAMGCDHLQGYHLGAPVDAETFFEMLEYQENPCRAAMGALDQAG